MSGLKFRNNIYFCSVRYLKTPCGLFWILKVQFQDNVLLVMLGKVSHKCKWIIKDS